MLVTDHVRITALISSDVPHSQSMSLYRKLLQLRPGKSLSRNKVHAQSSSFPVNTFESSGANCWAHGSGGSGNLRMSPTEDAPRIYEFNPQFFQSVSVLRDLDLSRDSYLSTNRHENPREHTRIQIVTSLSWATDEEINTS